MDWKTLLRRLLALSSRHHVVLILAGNPSVIHGKVEEISLPDGIDHVDIIISEWMGYALLYESMLDSVLHARDRFLRPNGGVMAPSQCRIMLALCEGSEIMKDRVDLWNDVYGASFPRSFIVVRLNRPRPRSGFDLSEMGHDTYNDAIIDVVSPESVLSEPYLLKVRLHFVPPFLAYMIHSSGSPSPNHHCPPTRVYVPVFTHLDLAYAHQNPRARALL